MGVKIQHPRYPGREEEEEKKRPSVLGLSCSSLLLTHRIVPRSVLPARGFILVSGTRNTGRHHHPPSVTVRTRTAATQQPATHRGNIQALLMSWSQNTEEKKDDHFPNTLCYHFVTTTSLQGPRRERAVLTFTSWTASTTKWTYNTTDERAGADVARGKIYPQTPLSLAIYLACFATKARPSMQMTRHWLAAPPRSSAQLSWVPGLECLLGRGILIVCQARGKRRWVDMDCDTRLQPVGGLPPGWVGGWVGEVASPCICPLWSGPGTEAESAETRVRVRRPLARAAETRRLDLQPLAEEKMPRSPAACWLAKQLSDLLLPVIFVARRRWPGHRWKCHLSITSCTNGRPDDKSTNRVLHS